MRPRRDRYDDNRTDKQNRTYEPSQLKRPDKDERGYGNAGSLGDRYEDVVDTRFRLSLLPRKLHVAETADAGARETR